MKPYGRLILGTLFVVFVVEILIFAPNRIEDIEEDLYTEEAEETEVDPSQLGAKIDQTMKGLHLVETRDGKKEWELWAENAASFKRKQMWKLKDVKAKFFGEKGDHFEVTGDRGQVQTLTKDMQVRGNVVTRSTNGYRFFAEEISYVSEERELSSEGPVRMYGPKDASGKGMILSGVGMSASLEDSLMQVQSDVQAEKVVDRDKEVHIASERAEFSGLSRKAVFIGNVVIDVETMRITGPVAEFKYNSEEKIVDSVFVNGGIKVSDMDKWATSRNLSVDFSSDKFVFRGQPRVVQNKDELIGEEIIFLKGGKRVVVKKGKAKVEEDRLENEN